MALQPILFDDSFFDFYRRPSRILDQRFGLGLSDEDLLAPLTVPRGSSIWKCPYFRPWRTLTQEEDVGSTVKYDKEKFQANLDVQQFKPNEISVKVTGDNEITVEGKHEEKQDEHGFISRQFVRRYVLPKNCDITKVMSKLSSDGVLTITAPRTDPKQIEEKKIPVTQTGQPAKPVEQKTGEQKK